MMVECAQYGWQTLNGIHIYIRIGIVRNPRQVLCVNISICYKSDRSR